MDNKKFEKLIDLIINENEEQARELFHDIIVEKSREIYESIMDEEMGGQLGDLLDEIDAEESGEMSEGEEGLDDLADLAGDEEEVIDMDADDMSAEEGEGEELEDAVVRIEDKLDQLMAEFEQIMGSDDAEEDLAGDEEDFADDEEDVADDEEEVADDEAGEEMMESVQLKQVGGNTYNSYGKMGDDGDQKKSPGLQNSGQAGMDSKPVKFSGQSESVPSSPKAPSNAYTKGETQVKGAGQFKNAPAQKTQDLGKAPAPVKSQASGVNTKSPVAEAKKATKKIVK